MTTFKVSDVKLASKVLDTFNVSDSIKDLTKNSLEACGSNISGDLVKVYKPMNALLKTMHISFDQHYPLVLSPDDIWICITQGLACHVNENAESLREQFVQHKGKLTLTHQNAYTKGSADNDWQSSFKWFSEKIKESIGAKHALIVSDFSTTGPVERAVSEIVLMDAMKNYFDYRETTMCGIPEITLLGTIEDWKSIRARAEVLSEFGLSWWTEHLLPFLDQFVAAKNEIVDSKFWKSLFHWNSGSGDSYVSGYVNYLFPYVKMYDKVGYWKNPTFGEVKSYIQPDKFPTGLSSVPFVWDYYGTIYNMDFLGGFVGVSQDSTSLAVRPTLGWAVRDQPSAQDDRNALRKSINEK